ncbi:MAG: host attachment protein [Rhodothalassiaceae bacterium]
MAKTTWIAAADAGRLIVYELHTGPHGREPVRILEIPSDFPESREIGSDRPGRSFDSHGEGRHAMEPPTDPKRHEAETFARRVAEELAGHADAGRFERLILAAAPAMLGDLRRFLPEPLRRKIIAERAKDLTRVPPDKLLAHFEDIVGL